MKKPILLSFLFLLSVLTKAQPSVQWQKCFGGSGSDQAYALIATADGGYATLGNSMSTNGNVTGNHGANDYWVVKFDFFGNIQWQKTYGGAGIDYGTSIIQTTDGGYMLAGQSNSTGGDVTGNHGGYDYWIVKLDATGNISWQKTYGGTAFDFAHSIIQTKDNGYIISGTTNSTNGDVTLNHGGYDEWIVKVDSAGIIQWQKSFGGSAQDGINTSGLNEIAIQTTKDGGYFVAGCSASVDGDVTGHHGPGGLVSGLPDYDWWLLKLDSTGNLQWEKSLGGTGIYDAAYSSLQTPDGGFIIAGQTSSTDGDVTFFRGVIDEWIVKIDSSGNLQWQKTLGGNGGEGAHFISSSADGGYVITGGSATINNGDVAGGYNQSDFWMTKIDIAGNLQWQKRVGGSSTDNAWAGFQTTDGGFIMSGFTKSLANDISGNHGSNDFWIVKLSSVPVNVITGNIYQDLSHNCIKDSGEIGLSGEAIEAVPGSYFATSDANGNYTLFVDSGNYTVSHITAQYYTQSCPASMGVYTVGISSATPNSYGNNFSDTLNTHCADLKVSIAAPFFQACFRNTLTVMYKNTGSVAASNVSIKLNFNLIAPLSSSVPWTQVGSDYIFNIGTVLPGQSSTFSVTDSVACVVVSGMQNECIWAHITTTTAECDTLNNLAHDCHTIVGSCDPNAKEVATQNNPYSVSEDISASDTLSYTIRFQNTGTDTAFTVVVRDTLPSYLDAATVEPGAASHPYAFRMYGQQILEWTFDDIKLCDSTVNQLASHGFLKFTIRQINGNVPGTTINNTGAIWFDYNNPVNTNRATATIPNNTTSIKKIDAADSVTTNFFPNPFETNAVLLISKGIKIDNAQLKLFDVTGKEVRCFMGINAHEINIEKGNLSPGFYFYQLKNNGKQVATGKLLVQ